MTCPLITLTAKDLRGCDANISGSGQRIGEIRWSDFGYCYVVRNSIICENYRGRFIAELIQCDPHDYIRAWLGPRGEMFPRTMYASVSMGFVSFETDMQPHDNRDGYSAYCPPALAAAMGDGVWKRTETGWAPVE